MSFLKLNSKQIPVLLILTACFQTGQNLMFDVSIFTDIEIPFTGREKAFCVLEYTRSQSNMTVQHAFVREFSKQSHQQYRLEYGKKNTEEGYLCRIKGSG